jgi:hypothetical protein
LVAAVVVETTWVAVAVALHHRRLQPAGQQ